MMVEVSSSCLIKNKNMERFLFLFRVAIESVLINKLRGMLTALGVIFGVAAVIAMLAIGSGAKKFLLDQMRLIGTNNIVFTHSGKDSGDDVKSEEDASAVTASNDTELETWYPGMSKSDLV